MCHALPMKWRNEWQEDPMLALQTDYRITTVVRDHSHFWAVTPVTAYISRMDNWVIETNANVHNLPECE